MTPEFADESLSDAFRRAREQAEESDTDETSDVSEETSDSRLASEETSDKRRRLLAAVVAAVL